MTGPDAPRSTSPFAPFRHRVFAAFWTGAFLSNIGTWMETVGVGIYVTAKTDNSGWTGLVAAAAFVPGALLGPVGGALADRLPRKALLLTTTSIQTALATLLAFLAATGHPSPGVVTLIVFAEGCAQAIGFPTYQSVLPDLVPQEDLVGAVALSSAQWNLGRVVGPALAGVVIRFGGYAWAFGINAASFFAVISAVTLLRLPPPHTDGSSIRRAIVQGVSYVRRDPGLRVVMGYMFVNTFLAAPFIALVPAMAQIVLHEGETGTAVLVTAQGLGAVTMALLLGNVTMRFGSRRVLLAVLWALPVGPRGLRRHADPRALGDRHLLRRAPLPRRAVELHVDRPDPSPGCDPRSGGERPRGRARRAVPARRGHPGRARRRDRPPADDLRRRRAHAGHARRHATPQPALRRRARAAGRPIEPLPPADARRDGCEDVDTDRLGLVPDEIPIRSADPHQ